MSLKEHYKRRMLEELASIGQSGWQPTTSGMKLPNPIRTPGPTYLGTGGMGGFGTQKVTFPTTSRTASTQAPASSVTKPGLASRTATKIVKAVRTRIGL